MRFKHENRVGGKRSSFLPTFVSDLSHHRTCGSAYGGSYFGYHSRYASIKVAYPAERSLFLSIALFRTGPSAIRQ